MPMRLIDVRRPPQTEKQLRIERQLCDLEYLGLHVRQWRKGPYQLGANDHENARRIRQLSEVVYALLLSDGRSIAAQECMACGCVHADGGSCDDA